MGCWTHSTGSTCFVPTVQLLVFVHLDGICPPELAELTYVWGCMYVDVERCTRLPI